MALLNASQSGSFLTASREPAATQDFGGAEAGVAQCPFGSFCCGALPPALLLARLRWGRAAPLSWGRWQGAGQLGVLRCQKSLLSFCC